MTAITKTKPKKKSTYHSNDISVFADVVLKLLFGIIVFGTCLYPLLIILASSFSDNMEILREGYSFLPKGFTLEAYDFVLQKGGQLGHSYFITIVNTLIGTTVGVCMMAMYAYAISRKDVKYAGFFSLFAYITFVFNGGLVPFYVVYSKVLGLGNTIWVMIIPYLVDVWYIVILKTYFANSIPHEVFESATIDGAGEIKIFIKIILPLAMPALATVVMFTILKYWNDFQLPLYFIEDTKLYNVQYMLYRIMSNMEFISQDTRSVRLSGPLPVESARMAMCVLGAGPLLVAYPFFQQYFIKGLTMGSVKG